MANEGLVADHFRTVAEVVNDSICDEPCVERHEKLDQFLSSQVSLIDTQLSPRAQRF